MRPVPISTSEEADAVQHAINVHLDHYHDIGEEESAEALSEALDTIEDERSIPGDAVSLVFDILVGHNHLRIATQEAYNGGRDGPHLVDVLTSIVAHNGDLLFEEYQDKPERSDAATAE